MALFLANVKHKYFLPSKKLLTFVYRKNTEEEEETHAHTHPQQTHTHSSDHVLLLMP